MKTARWMMFLGVAMALWLVVVPAVEAQAQAPNATHDATYDASQPGADDARVQDGFAAYQAGDFTCALDIWLPLAEAGNAEAQFRVGRLYDRGEGVRQDTDGMIGWYTLAANQGHVSAAYNLGVTYSIGIDVKKNVPLALEYFRVGASQRMIDAIYGLGITLARSTYNIRVKGGTSSYGPAYGWLLIAKERGDEQADFALEILNKLLTPDEREEGKKLTREWFKNHPRIRN